MKFQHLLTLLTTLLAGGLAGPVFAADPGPVPSKVYRNNKYGFEFRYPGDMQIETSSGPLDINKYPTTSGEVDYIMLRYSKIPEVSASITVEPAWTDEMGLTNNLAPCPDWAYISKLPLLNGFFVEAPTGEPRGASWQDYSTFQNGHCIEIRRTSSRTHPHEDEDIKVYRANIEKCYERLKEIVTSFRFVDSQSK